jgi:hypothetical protein
LTAQLLLRTHLLARPLKEEVRTGKGLFVIANASDDPSDEMKALAQWIVEKANEK